MIPADSTPAILGGDVLDMLAAFRMTRFTASSRRHRTGDSGTTGSDRSDGAGR